ncbi:MAG: DUF4214 domain-containing protein [Cyanobacteria bacterium]|nr:DUF4214 domain-containing protein [Cyanobacteriota bacterium]MDW8201127.1 DUF4214 domain-containing protein [Cyanobacteriota bacterium SKYGB_h_bin112]
METIVTRNFKRGCLAVATVMMASAIAAPVVAQSRTCVVDERTGQVACGRPATRSEIDRYYGGGGWNSGSQYSERQAYERINQLYRDILGRDGDFNSLRAYAYQLQSGRSLSDIRRELANSNEATEAIRRIYREVLGREADASGLYGYQRNLEFGWSLNQIRNEIANSQEARNRQ